MPGKNGLLAAISHHGGIATRRQLLVMVDATTIDAGARLRWVTRVHPHTYVAASVAAPSPERWASAAPPRPEPGAREPFPNSRGVSVVQGLPCLGAAPQWRGALGGWGSPGWG